MDVSFLNSNFGARISVFYFFSLEGVIVAIWSAVNPTIQEKLHITDGEFGSIILFFYLGGVIATALSGIVLKTFGSKWCTYISALIFTGIINLILIAPNVTWTIATMFLFGTMYGCMDVCMNSCAVLTEFVDNLPLLGKYHGTYAIASAIGASIASYCLGPANCSPKKLFIFFTIICTILTIISSTYLYNFKEELEICEFEKYRELIKENDEDDDEDDDDIADDDYIAQLLSDDTLNDSTNEKSSQLNSSNINKSDNNTRHRNNKNNKILQDGNELSESSLTTPLNPLYDEYSSRNSNDSSYLSFNRFRGNSETPSHVKTDDGNEYYYDNDGFFNTFKRCFYLACVGFISSFGECSITTWVVIYYKRIIESTSVLETLGFTGFMICMSLGRFSSDYLRQQYGRRRLIFYSGILASLGLFIVVTTPSIAYFFLSKDSSYVVTFITLLSTFGFSITGKFLLLLFLYYYF
jgi:MFS family permease